MRTLNTAPGSAARGSSHAVRERAALRTIAGLVARGAPSSEVFAVIAREVARVTGSALVQLERFESDGTATVVGVWGAEPQQEAVPTTGIADAAAAPIVVDGEVWGVMSARPPAHSSVPEDVEIRLAEFTGLVATAIASTASREALAQLAEQQAALRRVATLVARERSAAEVLAAVAEEVGRVLRVQDTRILRYEPDRTVTVVANWGKAAADIPVGTRWSATGENVCTVVLRTGRPARKDRYDDATGPIGEHLRRAGVRSGIGTPILVEGRLWGAMVANSLTTEPLHVETEALIEKFTELVATAISNIEARAELVASRNRLVAAGVEERRRVVRDLHDGAQQRLVHTVITLKLARAAVEIDVSVGRLPAAIEATAYFVVAEALTNVAKHSRAARAQIIARAEDATLRIQVRDDGVGGARRGGSGLVGLADRLAALDGRLRVESPRGAGTLVVAEIPIAGGSE